MCVCIHITISSPVRMKKEPQACSRVFPSLSVVHACTVINHAVPTEYITTTNENKKNDEVFSEKLIECYTTLIFFLFFLRLHGRSNNGSYQKKPLPPPPDAHHVPSQEYPNP